MSAPDTTFHKYIIFHNGKELWLDPFKVALHPNLESHFVGDGRNGTVTLFDDERAIQLFARWINYGTVGLQEELMHQQTDQKAELWQKLEVIFDYFNLPVPQLTTLGFSTSPRYIIFHDGKEFWLDPAKVALHPNLESHFKGPGRNGTVTLFGDRRAVQLFVHWIEYGNDAFERELGSHRMCRGCCIEYSHPNSHIRQKLKSIFELFGLPVVVYIDEHY
jgi:hypothetical protein